MNIAEVLLVDGDKYSRDIFGNAVRGHGYAIHEACSGEAAIEMLEARPEGYNVVFVNKELDGISGFDVLSRIKKNKTHQLTPVVVLTSTNQETTFADAVRLGAFAFLTKPVDELVLVEVLKSALRERIMYYNIVEDSKEYARAIQHMTQGTFLFRTIQEARSLAVFLAQAAPEPTRVIVGLVELLVNAVEHGNLAISYDLKTQLMNSGEMDAEMAKRMSDPLFGQRTAKVTVERRPEELVYTIKDQGSGFDWPHFLEIDATRLGHLHGRGIAIARQVSFDRLDYSDLGNVVEAAVCM